MKNITDADATILKGKLKLAEEYLAQGKSYKVFEILKDVSDASFPAVRLKFLADIGARDEYELAYYAGDIKKFVYFDKLIALCDEPTRKTYLDIADRCLANTETEKEISKGTQMLALKMYKEGLEFARAAVIRHPFCAKAWELLALAKCLTDKAYDPTEDIRRMLACPDARFALSGAETDVYGIPRNIAPAISRRCRHIYRKKHAVTEFFVRYILRPLIVVAAVAVTTGIWILIDRIFS